MEYPRITPEAARVNAHLLQRDAAKALGITPETLRSYEEGRTSPTIEMAAKMAGLYGFPVELISFAKQSTLAD